MAKSQDVTIPWGCILGPPLCFSFKYSRGYEVYVTIGLIQTLVLVVCSRAGNFKHLKFDHLLAGPSVGPLLKFKFCKFDHFYHSQILWSIQLPLGDYYVH